MNFTPNSTLAASPPSTIAGTVEPNTVHGHEYDAPGAAPAPASAPPASATAAQTPPNCTHKTRARRIPGATHPGLQFASPMQERVPARRNPQTRNLYTYKRCKTGDRFVSPRRYRDPDAQPTPLDRFSAPVRAWFETSFAAPTDAQAQGWPAIADGDHTLILAPTGSGKTLAAFLWAIDRLGATRRPAKDRRCRVLYISPLRALAVRRREEPARRRSRASRSRPSGSASPFHAPTVAHAHRRHPEQGAPAARPQPARHPDHHARVALPHAHVAGARDAARRASP